MARSHQAKENRRIERIEQKHPDNAAERCYEYARIKKLENRVLNKKEKHTIKMKDSVEGKLIKLSEKLTEKRKPVNITSKSKHVHQEDLEAVKEDFGEDTPYFRSSREMRGPSETELVDSIIELLEQMPFESLLSDCRNPKVSRIIQNAIRHSSKDEMSKMIQVLFRDKLRKGEEAISSEFSEGLLLDVEVTDKLLATSHEHFMQNARKALMKPAPTKSIAFLNLCTDNYASFIVCTLIRHATHAVFSQILHEFCIPLLPNIIKHKSTLRVAHFLFMHRFCGKKERNQVMMCLLIGAITAHRDKIPAKSLQIDDSDKESTGYSIQNLLDREQQWWSNLTTQEKESSALHVHCALFYCCQLFIEKTPKAVTFPIGISFLKIALSLEKSQLPAELVEARAELLNSTASAMAQSMGVLFTASASMAIEWSKDTFATLTIVVRELSDEKFAEFISSVGPYLQKLLQFANKAGRYGSQRLLCALLLRCSLSEVSFKGIAPSVLRHIMHSNSFKEFNSAIFEEKRLKRRRRKKAKDHSEGLVSPNSADALRVCTQVILRIVTEKTKEDDSLCKSFFGQYSLETLPSLTGVAVEYAVLILAACVLELQRFDASADFKEIIDSFKSLQAIPSIKYSEWDKNTHEFIHALLKKLEGTAE